MDVSGTVDVINTSYAPRITKSFAELEKIINIWAKHCERMAVYEHDKDSGVAKTHCHILMEGCSIQVQQFKRAFHKFLPGITERGNALWEWEHKNYPVVDDHFLTYMSKGVLRPKYVKDYPPDLIEERRQQWVQPTPKTVKSSQSDQLDDLIKAFFSRMSHNTQQNMTLESVRFWTFQEMYRKSGRIPPASQYKQYAGTLYLKIGERLGRYEQHASEVFNLWY